MPDYSKQIVYLSQAQYQELITNGTITVDGVTVTYNENDIYVTPQAEPVTDVQVNGTSIASNGVANIPMATENSYGVVMPDNASLGIANYLGIPKLTIKPRPIGYIKGENQETAITASMQHQSTFYGLAKAAGDTTQKNSDNAVGTYTDEAKQSIQQMLGVSSLIAPSEPTLIASKAYAVGDVFTANGKLYKVTTAIAAAESIVVQNEGDEISGHNAEECKMTDYAVHDVQVNGTSVVSNGVANVPIASTSNLGLIKPKNGFGISVNSAGQIYTVKPITAEIKAGTHQYNSIVPYNQHESVFYGLAKAAGDSTQSASSNAVGTYTDSAKASIKSMLGIVDGSTGTVSVTGTTPSITAVENTRYVCGEVVTLTITPPASGICIIRFTSGTTPTVLTATGVVWPEWFDDTALETERVYEICITDGYGAVMSWAL